MPQESKPTLFRGMKICVEVCLGSQEATQRQVCEDQLITDLKIKISTGAAMGCATTIQVSQGASSTEQPMAAGSGVSGRGDRRETP